MVGFDVGAVVVGFNVGTGVVGLQVGKSVVGAGNVGGSKSCWFQSCWL